MNQANDDKKESRSSIAMDDDDDDTTTTKDQTTTSEEVGIGMKQLRGGSSSTEGINNDEKDDERKPSAVPRHNKSDNDNNKQNSTGALISSSEEKDSSTKEEEDQSQQQQQQQQIIIPSVVIETPEPSDVLFGRGRPYQAHSGNVRLHKIVDRHKYRYSQSRRFDKLAIVDQIVYEVKSKGDGGDAGRFLKRSDNGEHWEEVTDDVAREKVAHALRGKIKQARESNSNNIDPSPGIANSAPKAPPPASTATATVGTAVPQNVQNTGLVARPTNPQTLMQARSQFPLSLVEQLMGPNQLQNQMGANFGGNHQLANPLISAQLLMLQQQQQEQQEQERLQQHLQQLLSQNPGLLLALLSSRSAPELGHTLANNETLPDLNLALALLQGSATSGTPSRLHSVPTPAPSIDLTQLLLARELENARTRSVIEQLLQGSNPSGENEQQQQRRGGSEEKDKQG